MTLREYLEGINEFVTENPETLDMIVISAIDSEGNGFNPVNFGPCKGVFDDGEFIQAQQLIDEPDEYDYVQSDFNAVCIN